MKRILITMVFWAVAGTGIVHADDPEYMILTPGQPVEISGHWSDKGIFAAKEIEVLPAERRPKLRGAIADIDSAGNRIQVFGRWITITSETQFLGAGDIPAGVSGLKINNRVEVSCKVDSLGVWSARHMRVHKVKRSDKIKGNITRTAFDGRAPDSLLISGLPVLVSGKTVIFRTMPITPTKTKDSGGGSDTPGAFIFRQ